MSRLLQAARFLLANQDALLSPSFSTTVTGEVTPALMARLVFPDAGGVVGVQQQVEESVEDHDEQAAVAAALRREIEALKRMEEQEEEEEEGVDAAAPEAEEAQDEEEEEHEEHEADEQEHG